MSKQIGYVRVSSVDQNTGRQLEGITLDKVFTDKASGKSRQRPQLEACLEYLRDGDTLHVHSIDRFARNLQDLLTLISDLTSRAVTVQFHKEGLIFTGEDSPFQRLQLQIIGSVAEFERAMIRERQREGIALAKKEGKYKGRKAALDEAQIAEARLQINAGAKVAQVARNLEVSRQTLYSALARTPEIKERLLSISARNP